MARRILDPRPAGRGLHLVATVTVLAGMAGVPACNAALGIEERELVEETEDALTCEAYCETTAQNCTDDFQQYESAQACLAMCEQLPLGAEGDTSGNTIGCRLRNAELAAETGERGDHCPLAGPAGCGDRCANFCSVFVPACSEVSESARDEATCLAFCQGSPDNPEWTPLVDALRDHDASIQCRLWHLANAALAPDVHCAHADGTTKCELPGGGAGGGGG